MPSATGKRGDVLADVLRAFVHVRKVSFSDTLYEQDIGVGRFLIHSLGELRPS